MGSIPEENQFYRLSSTGTIVLVDDVSRFNVRVYDPVYEQYITLRKPDAAMILGDETLSQDDVRAEMKKSSERISYFLNEMLKWQVADIPIPEMPQQPSHSK